MNRPVTYRCDNSGNQGAMRFLCQSIALFLLILFLCSRSAPLLATEPKETPKLTGEKISVAKQVATVAELKPVVGTYYIATQNWRNDIRSDVVYMQSPQPGIRVPAGTTIAVWRFVKASENRKLADVPNLRGEKVEDALQLLDKLGLKPFEADDADGTIEVLDQYPEPDTKVFVGTSIYFTIRK
ncbi:MAG: PASTA domain-containing protein [Planctomycetales bacterium]|nr:PASTA domain-containing protein [Planctomycetales bacterium]